MSGDDEREPLLLARASNDISDHSEEANGQVEAGTDLLRRVPDRIPTGAYWIILTELFERAVIAGVGAPFQNYLANPLPPAGNGAGAPAHGSPFPAGALGLRQSLATALVMGFEAISYVSPIGGAILADVKWGRHRTILLSCPLCLLGLAILTGSSTPQALDRSLGLPGWILGASLYAIGLGGIKPNLAPLVADQRNHQNPFTKTLPSGERVLVDPSLTLSKIYNVYFWFINIGAFSPLAITAAERYIGFWLAFLIPSTIFLLVPLTLLISRNRCVRYPPQGSVLLNACKCIILAFWRVQGGNGDTRFEHSDSWELAKPSYYENISHKRPLTMAEMKHASEINWTDSFVDEIRQTLRACQIFLFFPLYWVAYDQISTNLISQSATMDHRYVPNDLIRHFEAIAIMIFIPTLNAGIYPALRRHKLNYGPMRRIYTGFILATLAIIYAAALQHRIYTLSPCRRYASGCSSGPAPISVWLQLPAYLLLALSQLMVAITGMEYGYAQSHKGLKSIVMCLLTLTIAGGGILNMIIAPFAHDPILTEFYCAVAFATFAAGTVFYVLFKGRDGSDLS